MDYEFEIMQDGMIVASGQAPSKDEAETEALHYALIYAMDGSVTWKVFESRPRTI